MNVKINLNKQVVNRADEIIITLHSGAKYLYTGTFQYKLHENGKWSYMDSYNTNMEYIDRMYNINSIHSIELLHKDSNLNRTIYLD